MRPGAASRSPARTPNLVAVAFDLESVLRRDRLVVVIALVAVIVLSWVYVLAGAGMGMSAFEMTRMTQPVGVIDSTQPSVQGMSMEGTAVGGTMVTGAWTVGYAVVIFFMWWVMMFGMMLPSASPLLLLFARMMRKEKDKGAPYVPTGVFALGYVIMWAAFFISMHMSAGTPSGVVEPALIVVIAHKKSPVRFLRTIKPISASVHRGRSIVCQSAILSNWSRDEFVQTQPYTSAVSVIRRRRVPVSQSSHTCL